MHSIILFSLHLAINKEIKVSLIVYFLVISSKPISALITSMNALAKSHWFEPSLLDMIHLNSSTHFEHV